MDYQLSPNHEQELSNNGLFMESMVVLAQEFALDLNFSSSLWISTQAKTLDLKSYTTALQLKNTMF